LDCSILYSKIHKHVSDMSDKVTELGRSITELAVANQKNRTANLQRASRLARAEDQHTELLAKVASLEKAAEAHKIYHDKTCEALCYQRDKLADRLREALAAMAELQSRAERAEAAAAAGGGASSSSTSVVVPEGFVCPPPPATGAEATDAEDPDESSEADAEAVSTSDDPAEESQAEASD
jgi:septal ring factor EnvC (AmiA/AmiB activator)